MFYHLLSHDTINNKKAKSSSLKTAEKILKSKNQSQNQNSLILNELKEDKLKRQMPKKSISKTKARSLNQDYNAFFSKKTNPLPNLKKNDKTLTLPSKKLLTLNNIEIPLPQVSLIKPELPPIRRTSTRRRSSKYSNHAFQMQTQRKKKVSIYKECLDTLPNFKTCKEIRTLNLISDPKLRKMASPQLTPTQRVEQIQKEIVKNIRFDINHKDKQSENETENESHEEKTNFYIQRQISRKSIFCTNQRKSYKVVLPMIKTKKIHLR